VTDLSQFVELAEDRAELTPLLLDARRRLRRLGPDGGRSRRRLPPRPQPTEPSEPTTPGTITVEETPYDQWPVEEPRDEPEADAPRERRERATDDTGRQRPVAHRSVTPENADQVAEDLTRRWRSATFHMRYGVQCDAVSGSHSWSFPQAGFSATFGVSFEGGFLAVDGRRTSDVELGDNWLGGRGQMNLVEGWFDGSSLRLVVNGADAGEFAVGPRGSVVDDLGRWYLSLSGCEIQHLWIEEFTPEP